MKPVANSILTNIMFIIECLVYMYYVDVFLWRYTIYCICLNEEGLFLNLQMNSKCTHVSLTFSICRDLNLNCLFISNTYFFFDILVVNIAMYTLIQYRHDIDNIEQIYINTFYIIDIADISISLTSSTLSTSRRRRF